MQFKWLQCKHKQSDGDVQNQEHGKLTIQHFIEGPSFQAIGTYMYKIISPETWKHLFQAIWKNRISQSQSLH